MIQIAIESKLQILGNTLDKQFSKNPVFKRLCCLLKKKLVGSRLFYCLKIFDF